MKAEDLFKALADPTRLRLLALMAAEGEVCVSEFTQALRVSQPKISRHLALLRRLGLVDDRRFGQWVFYRPAATLPDWVRQVLDHTVRGLSVDLPFSDDLARLSTMSERPPRSRAA